VSDVYDALVIGGGPGGSATAFHLASGGARVCLVEKHTYPRDKVCGDGLTPRAVRALDAMGLREEYRTWSRSAGLKVHGGGHVIELPWPELEDYPSFGLARPRADLDHLLARTAAKAMEDAKLARNVEVQNLPGAGNTIALQHLVNDKGNGGIIASFCQEIDGIPVFRDEVKVLLGESAIA